jgi:hypothetical protein
MTIEAGLFDFLRGVTSCDILMATSAWDFSGHWVRFAYFSGQSAPLYELVLNSMAGGACRVGFFVMASDTTGPIHYDLPVFIRM